MLLRVDNLHTAITVSGGVNVPVVAGVSFELARGKTLALVGESGSGKSITACSILRLLPPSARITQGAIWFDGRDLATLSIRELRRLRGARIAMIFQEPMTCLNPVLSIAAQLTEPLRLHRGLGARRALDRAVQLLEQVGIREPHRRLHDYPHQLSGGMRQRVMIAMALACEPDLLIADEPTTALDVTIQAQILDLLRALQRRRQMAMLFISHDLGVVAALADDIAVMYAGRLVERAPAGKLLTDPQHPYTRGLLACTPRLEAAPGPDDAAAGSARLPVIPGEVPEPRLRPPGCAFHPRCALAGDEARCRQNVPPLHMAADGHASACWKSGALALVHHAAGRQELAPGSAA